MAIFNPDVPNPSVSDPNWTNVSKPISDEVAKGTADKSAAIALGAAGDILTSATKAVDYDIKQAAKEDVQTGVDNLRDGYTEALKGIRNVQTMNANASLLPETNTPDAPASLQAGLDRAKNIGTALSQGGTKVNDTLYTGALNSLTKQLRAQYPGYRDYIDEQIQAVSGVNPANAFYKNLMEDINKAQDKDKTDINATKSMLREAVKEGFHDTGGTSAAKVLDLYDKGVVSKDQVNSWYNSARKLEYDTKTKATARASRQGDEADTALNATKDLSTTAAQTVSHNWDTMTIGKGTDTAKGLFDFIQTNAGNQAVKDERSTAIGMQLRALRDQTAKQLLDQANEGGPNSIVAKLGGDVSKAKAVIDGQLATFDLAINAVFKGEWGAAYSHAAFNKAISADSTDLLYNAPDADVRRYNRMVGAINNISPQAGLEFFKSSLLGGVPKGEKEYLKTVKMDLLTQPDQPVGKLTTVQGVIDQSKAKGMKSPKSYQDLINTVDEISNPKWATEQRLNLARGFFNPEANGQLLADKNFSKDRYDETLKREIPGKYAIFRKLTSENVASGINELAKTDPSIRQQYHDTLSRNFGEQLFSRELKDLGESNTESTPTGSNYKIKFSDDTKRPPHFEAVRPDGSPMTMGEATAYGAPVRSLNRLNEGMSSLWTAYKGTGVAEPGNEVMKQVYRYNYQDATNKAPRGYESIGDMPKAIWNAILSANNARLKEQGDLVSSKGK